MNEEDEEAAATAAATAAIETVWMKMREQFITTYTHFPTERVDRALDAMYQDFKTRVALHERMTVDREVAEFCFEIRWGLKDDIKPRPVMRQVDIEQMVEAINQRDEDLCNFSLTLCTSHFLAKVMDEDLARMLARACCRCPRWSAFRFCAKGDYNFPCNRINYFFQEAVAESSQCRLTLLEINGWVTEDWVDSLVLFLQSSTTLSELSLCFSCTSNNVIECIMLQGANRCQALQRLRFHLLQNWLEPGQQQTIHWLEPVLIGGHSQQQPRQGLRQLELMGRLFPQAATALARCLCLGSLECLVLRGVILHAFVQFVERIKAHSLEGTRCALKQLHLHSVRFDTDEFEFGNDELHTNQRYLDARDVLDALILYLPLLEAFSVVDCVLVPRYLSPLQSYLREFSLGLKSNEPDLHGPLLEHMPLSPIQTVNLLANEFMVEALRGHPRSLDNVQELRVDRMCYDMCCEHSAAFDKICAILLNMLQTNTNLCKASGKVLERMNYLNGETCPLANQAAFDWLCRRNQCIRKLSQSSRMPDSLSEDQHQEPFSTIPCQSLWSVVLAALYDIDKKGPPELTAAPSLQPSLLLSTIDAAPPARLNLTASTIFTFLRQHSNG